MTREPTFIDFVREVSPASGRAKSAKPKIKVSFTGGIVVYLNPLDTRERVWGEVLDSLRASREPAYVELDASARRITSLLLPQTYIVVEIRRSSQDGDLQIEFDRSHAVHYLRRQHPRFEELLKSLEESYADRRSVLVPDSLDASGLVDVRLANSVS